MCGTLQVTLASSFLVAGDVTADVPGQNAAARAIDFRVTPAYPLLERGHMNGYSALVVTALCVLLGLPSASLAQGGYFGRNKVQYREFDFKVLKTDHFDIYYYPEEEQAAKMASRMAERWYTRLSQLLNHQLTCTPAPHPLRERVALSPDQRHRRRARRRHRRCHRGLQTTHRAAVCRSDRGERPRPRARARARVPVRHHRDQRQLGFGRRARAAAVVHRRDGGVPVDRSGRSAHGDVDARGHAARAAAGRRQARQPQVLPVSLRPRALGLHRRQVRRRRRREHAPRRGGARRDLRRRRSRPCCRSIPSS